MPENSETFLDRLAGRVSGEIDHEDEVGTDLLEGAHAAPGPRFVIACSDLTFIDSSGINMLLHVKRLSGKNLHLVNLTPGCQLVIEMMDLGDVFGVDPIAP